tara:strand:+ start:43 stop:879 length:837 start_codon:yes stop_codon:yes gene_type:complete
MRSELTVIITLFKTPIDKLKTLKQYNKYPILIFDQSTKDNSKKISENLNFNFQYFHSEKNLGLSKSTNFLISKVKTKYFLFTQADIEIDEISINNLLKGMNVEKNIVFAGPIINSNNDGKKQKEFLQNYQIKTKLNAAIMMCDLEKVKNIGFFNEDFFLYWEDEDLMQRVNKSNYKMIQISNSFASHDGGKSTPDNINVLFIRRINYKYGELLYDLKHKKIRIIKILRQLLLNILLLTINFVFFNKIKIVENISQICGILKFIKYVFFRKNSKTYNVK